MGQILKLSMFIITNNFAACKKPTKEGMTFKEHINSNNRHSLLLLIQFSLFPPTHNYLSVLSFHSPHLSPSGTPHGGIKYPPFLPRVHTAATHTHCLMTRCSVLLINRKVFWWNVTEINRAPNEKSVTIIRMAKKQSKNQRILCSNRPKQAT